MPKGTSLHIGLNAVDPNAYAGWAGTLNACEADATDLVALATAVGFSSMKVLTADATRNTVLRALREAAEEIGPGDVFLLTYSGHGSRVPDKNADESDFMDETWCLFDGQLIDDELYEVWSMFAPGTRIVVLSDSCHSGTIIKDLPQHVVSGAGAASSVADAGGNAPRYAARSLPTELIGRAYRARQELYDSLQQAAPRNESEIASSVLLISGCQDPQQSMDGPFNGAFTAALLRVWNEGTFSGNYPSFHPSIQRQLPLTQQPNLMTLGRGPSFAEQAPFTI